MISSRKSILVVVVALVVLVGFISVGCSRKPANGVVNTDAMPGKRFSRYVKHDKAGNSSIVYLGGDEKTAPASNFGPTDVNFEFSSLR